METFDEVRKVYGAGIIGKAKFFLFETDPMVLLAAFAGLLMVAALLFTGRRLPLVFMLLVALLLNGSVIVKLDALSAVMRVFLAVVLALSAVTARRSPGWAWGLFALYFTVGSLMIIRSPNLVYTLQWSAMAFAMLLAALAVADYAKDRIYVARICMIFIFAAFVWTAVGSASIRELASGEAGGSRLSGASITPGLFTQTGAVLLPFALWGAMRPDWNKLFRLFCGAMMIPMAVLLLVSAQRTGTIAGAVACMPMLVRVRFGRALFVLAILGGIGLMGYQLLQANEQQRNFLVKRYFADDLSNRDRIWAESIDNLLRDPILGHGFGASKDDFRIETGNSAHNAYLVAWYDSGALGLLLFLLSFAVGAWQAFWLARRGKTDPEVGEFGRLFLGLILAIGAMGLVSAGASSASDIVTTTLLFSYVMVHRLMREAPARQLPQFVPTRARPMALQYQPALQPVYRRRC